MKGVLVVVVVVVIDQLCPGHNSHVKGGSVFSVEASYNKLCRLASVLCIFVHLSTDKQPRERDYAFFCFVLFYQYMEI